MSFFLQPFKGDSSLLSQGPFSFFPGIVAGHKGGSDVTMYEHKNSIVVEAAAPGMNAKDINISYERGVLTIQASKKEEKEDKEKRFFHKSSSSFVYHLHVPGNIDEKVTPKAEISEGLVKVVFAKHKTPEGPKTISVEGKNTTVQHKPVAKHASKKPGHKK